MKSSREESRHHLYFEKRVLVLSSKFAVELFDIIIDWGLTYSPMKKYAILIVSLFLLTGCAITRDHISLNYDPMIDVQKIPEAETIQVQVAVTDKRVNKDRVGRKINGYGMPMALIVCQNQVDELVKEALAKELANRGFMPSIQDPKILVDVELLKLSNKFKLGFFTPTGISETNLNLKVQNLDGTVKYTKTVLGKGINHRVIQLDLGKNAKIALELSLKDAIEQVVEDPEFIKALLDNSQMTPVIANHENVKLSAN